MKILHAISQRPDSTGSGIYLQAILSASAAAGYENSLIAGIPEGPVPKLTGVAPGSSTYIRFSSDVKSSQRIVGMSDTMPYPSRTFRSLNAKEIDDYLNRFRSALDTMISRHRPDLIHSHHVWLLTCLIAEMFPRIPLVASCHGSDLRQYRQCIHLQSKIKKGCQGIDAVLALSSDQKSEIARTYQIKKTDIAVIGAGYNDSLFCSPAGGKECPPTHILYAGKISRAKGVPWLLKALRKMSRQARSFPFHLHLAGSGFGTEFEACLEECTHLADKITCHGLVSQATLAELMKQSHIFILPSLHEGLPLVVLEALACGCQVITTDLPGCRDIKSRIVSEQLMLIDTPDVVDTDATLLGNENQFIDDICSALLNAVASRFSSHTDELSYYTWSAVFQRIEQVWLKTQK